MGYFVYILQSDSSGKYYIGSTDNIQRRVSQHNAGYSKATKSGVPWVLKRAEEYSTLTEARQREAQIKRMKSKKWIEWLLGEGVQKNLE
jgi:putative endonuclease